MASDERQLSGPGAPLPSWLEAYVEVGTYGLVIGAILFLGAFLTNPVPDPSFHWATLPASLRLPFEQPRIEHWPVSYTAGVWLWVFFLPALFLHGYRRFGRRARFGDLAWFVAAPTLAMIGWTTYCRFFWPKLYPRTWNAPAYTFVCWLYCATYDPIWSDAAYAIAGLGLVATWLAWRGMRKAPIVLAGFGVLSLPLGVPVLYEAYRRFEKRSA